MATESNSCEPSAAVVGNDAAERTYGDLGLEEFAVLFGTAPDRIPDDCRALIGKYDFRYRKLMGEERDLVLLSVLKTIDSGQLTVAGKDRKARWEEGWSENLQEFIRQGNDLSALIPKYIRQGKPLRIFGDYVIPIDPSFEFSYFDVFRLWLFRTYFEKVDNIYEFGCGSGYNLAALAQIYPEKKLYGLDWATASMDIMETMAKAYGWNIEGLLFDYFAPDQRIKIADNSGVFTIGSLEQVGQNYEPFLQYLLERNPRVCVHVEPAVEWFDENNLMDYVALRYHKSRGYLEGFSTRLKQLEEQGKIQIISSHKGLYGNLYMEGWSQLVWKPLSSA
jgi:SAM-dependent methyltransferase